SVNSPSVEECQRCQYLSFPQKPSLLFYRFIGLQGVQLLAALQFRSSELSIFQPRWRNASHYIYAQQLTMK
ncbi:MAG: hypothetical protein DMF25_03295, partial [Verrucomicrobia bacterium]